jgi:1-acyl-sn-glycerol-3-phosphate acyltransferase
VGKGLAHVMMPTFGRITVEGRENVPPYGPVLFAANHQSNADPPLVVYASPRPVWFMAKRGLFAGPIPRYFLSNLHAFPVDRDGRDLEALSWVLEALKRDRAVLVFPEGTRNQRGLREPANDGLAYLALRSGAPIVPVGITGTENIPGFIRIAFPFTRMRVRFGQPFTLPQVEGRMSRELLHSFTNQIMERIAMILPDDYQGSYAIGTRHEGTKNT